MLFIMTWYILRHVGVFFAMHPVWATLCTIAYVTGGVLFTRLYSKSKDYNTRKIAENVFLFGYLIPICAYRWYMRDNLLRLGFYCVGL